MAAEGEVIALLDGDLQDLALLVAVMTFTFILDVYGARPCHHRMNCLECQQDEIVDSRDHKHNAKKHNM